MTRSSDTPFSLPPQLDKTLQKRRDHQKKKAVIERSAAAKLSKSLRSGKANKKPTSNDDPESDDDDDEQLDIAAQMGGSDDEDEAGPSDAKFKGMSVDDFLGGGFKAGAEDDDDDEEEDDQDSLGDIEEMSDDGAAHAQDLEKLKEKDPEFYKYLLENDKDLLNFGQDEQDDDEEMDDDQSDAGASTAEVSTKAKGKQKGAVDDEGAQRVTLKMLGEWQSLMLKQRSIKALRKLLLAFRCAVRIGASGSSQQDDDAPFFIDDAKVFNKIVITTLKYTPMILQHHIPAKTTADGRFKVATNTKKWALLRKPIISYFSSLFHLLQTLSDKQMLYLVVSESAKMVPYALTNKKTSRELIKHMLTLWSTSDDNVRVVAFLVIRKAAAGGDADVLELCLRGAYSSYVKSTKLTTVHTLPSINLMKNSASELYALDAGASYQQAFGFIRQLAIHLRNCLKTRTKDSFKAVFNWQYVHCIDFWALVLSTSRANELVPLIYPLVQVAVGAMGLVPTSRYFPFRLHVLRSVLRLVSRTETYVPLLPFILGIFESPEFHRKPKGSTLKPIDFDTTLRAPSAYVRTRVYADQLAEEATFVLLEFLASQSRSIAFPELVIPATVQLKRGLKHYTSPKLVASLKQILDKVAQNSVWIQKRRDDVEFAPANIEAVDSFLQTADDKKKETPLESALRLAKKVREQKRAMLAAQSHVVGDNDDESD